MSLTSPKIAIIGGGAAGLMSAATLLESNKPCEVHLFEKNKNLGAKIIISGGGRCNVTTGLTDKQQLLKKYTRGSVFLKAALSKFPPQKVYQWFEDHGVPLKTEKDQRVFPKSNDGQDIVRIFEKLFFQKNAVIHYSANVKRIEKKEKKFIIITEKDRQEFDAVIIATGGNAYRNTGSTGDGYAFATALGHTITQLGPSLTSFVLKEKWTKELTGISLPNAGLKYKKISVTGPLLFTHFGISGPVVFSLSSQVAFENIAHKTPLPIQLRPDAAKKTADWEKIFLEASAIEGKKQIKTFLQTFFPQRFVEFLLKSAAIEPTDQMHGLSKKNRRSLSLLLSDRLILTVEQRRPGEEFVTAGGVSTDEINPQTMESLITPNLYFAGEILNIDGITGGYNLQACWATGHLAGKSIISKNLDIFKILG